MQPRRASPLIQRLEANRNILGTAAPEPLPKGLFLGIIGLLLQDSNWDLEGALRIQVIGSRPGAHEVARALSDQRVAAIIGRYGPLVVHELAVGPEITTGDEAISVGLDFMSLLRVKTLSELLIPAALSCSWSATVLNRVPPQSCDATLLEDIPATLSLEDPKAVSKDDLNWVFEHLSTFQQLYATTPAYALAVDSLCQHSQQTNVRMAAAMLWSGIEALFGLKGEINFRLALYIAAFLEDLGSNRLTVFAAVRSEYNTRSRIVHGDTSDEHLICNHVIKTRQFLSHLLCKSTENRGIPSKEALDAVILAGDTAGVISEQLD